MEHIYLRDTGAIRMLCWVQRFQSYIQHKEEDLYHSQIAIGFDSVIWL